MFDSSAIDKTIDLGNDNTFVIERHVSGEDAFEIRYEAGPDVDLEEKLAEHAESLWQSLADQEVEGLLNG